MQFSSGKPYKDNMGIVLVACDMSAHLYVFNVSLQIIDQTIMLGVIPTGQTLIHFFFMSRYSRYLLHSK